MGHSNERVKLWQTGVCEALMEVGLLFRNNRTSFLNST